MQKQTKCDGTWLGDPAHFRRPNRRDFLYVGMLGGIGLTLGDFFKARSAGSFQGEIRQRLAEECDSYLFAGWDCGAGVLGSEAGRAAGISRGPGVGEDEN